MSDTVSLDSLKGKTIIKFEGLRSSEDYIKFWTSDGYRYDMYHEQDCCESVSVDDIVGDPEDILNEVLLLSEESTDNKRDDAEYSDSCTWTFYRFGTIKGHLDIKWYGTSNGYYSESVSIYEHRDIVEVRDMKIDNVIN